MQTTITTVPAATGYRHTQIGWGMIAVMLLVLGFIIAITQRLPAIALVIHTLIISTTIAMFCTLTIRVDSEQLRWRFGVGLIRKHTPIAEIAGCEVVRNKWWWGLGIRLIPAGYWLYNVSGLDAVEVTLKNGKRFRLGTDEPARLHQAIRSTLDARG